MRTIALTFAVFSLAASTSAAEIYKLNKTTKARKEVLVAWFFKNLKDNCETGKRKLRAVRTAGGSDAQVSCFSVLTLTLRLSPPTPTEHRIFRVRRPVLQGCGRK